MSKVITFLCAGGLGDAAMCFAKLSSSKAPFPYDIDRFKITHMVHKGTDEILSEQISKFYSSQGINSEIVVVTSWSKALSADGFDYVLDGGWKGNKECWEINPFPEIKYKSIDGVDVVLVVASGYSCNRKFAPLDIRRFIDQNKNRKITITGVNIRDPEYLNIHGDNRINNMEFMDYMNAICCCNTIISPNGFSCYLSGMAKRKVFYTSDGIGTTGNMHPDWNKVEIHNLAEVKL